MSTLSDRIASRQKRERTQVEIEEWGDNNEPLVLFFGPLLAGEMDRVQRKHPEFPQRSSFSGMVELIIMKAEDASGAKVFTLEDKAILMREPLTLIAEIAGQMMEATSIEVQEKN